MNTQTDVIDDEECPHLEGESGICCECGDEIDWVSRRFSEDMDR
jgi:RNA polymerase-binding transcription factor DksA